ncbi:hypothetical protein PHYSODRAFT_334875 [Phytophthora sojae]|uniref:Uncharacterized protein n=1 Tax=Phytophthora sojae (strain P6497) TaxID=1094619 RepID=G4ZSX1_PHYSP|nr:hypothetical protein PHYSODRAFT_334875 [Phytophthora sojae]EGZ13056.1 hypothetical protein PHYSODRAFT_334875 [Phytophthora sojae]|eukprot:XP_009530485.1 hypothetical protein PHYSODRAFT_334875 [Phytophthora sojae]
MRLKTYASRRFSGFVTLDAQSLAQAGPESMSQYPRSGLRGTQARGTSKYSTKQTKIEMFSGDVKEVFLDAGAGDWLRRLSIQIRLGEMVDASHLEGTALTWFTRRFDALQRMTFEELSTALREKFRCPLDRFAHRLNVIAATVNNGEESKATVEDALPKTPDVRWIRLSSTSRRLPDVTEGSDSSSTNTIDETYDTDSDDENGTENSSNETRNGDDSEDNRRPTKTRRLNSETAQVAQDIQSGLA